MSSHARSSRRVSVSVTRRRGHKRFRGSSEGSPILVESSPEASSLPFDVRLDPQGSPSLPRSRESPQLVLPSSPMGVEASSFAVHSETQYLLSRSFPLTAKDWKKVLPAPSAWDDLADLVGIPHGVSGGLWVDLMQMTFGNKAVFKELKRREQLSYHVAKALRRGGNARGISSPALDRFLLGRNHPNPFSQPDLPVDPTEPDDYLDYEASTSDDEEEVTPEPPKTPLEESSSKQVSSWVESSASSAPKVVIPTESPLEWPKLEPSLAPEKKLVIASCRSAFDRVSSRLQDKYERYFSKGTSDEERAKLLPGIQDLRTERDYQLLVMARTHTRALVSLLDAQIQVGSKWCLSWISVWWSK